MDGGDGLGRVSSILQGWGQPNLGDIFWVWDSMNTGSRMPDGAGMAR